MSLLKSSFVGAVAMVTLFQGSALYAQTTTHDSLRAEKQAKRMHIEGVRLPVDANLMHDLQVVTTEAAHQSELIGDDCELNDISQIQLEEDGIAVIAGYEAYLVCADSPTPAVGVYFDVNQQYLDTLAFTE
jgi:hypothetical protein